MRGKESETAGNQNFGIDKKVFWDPKPITFLAYFGPSVSLEYIIMLSHFILVSNSTYLSNDNFWSARTNALILLGTFILSVVLRQPGLYFGIDNWPSDVVAPTSEGYGEIDSIRVTKR